MMKRLILVASMMVATPAAAERFAVIDFNMTHRSMVALNLDTLRQVNGKWRGWEMIATNVNPKDEPIYVQSLYEFDCNEESYRVLTTRVYDANDNMKQTLDGFPSKYPAPNTPGYVAVQYACGKKVADPEMIVNDTPAGLFRIFQNGLRNGSAK
jgi:hypothetical protein